MTTEIPDDAGNDMKFIVDNSLPGIAKHLRVLGIDVLFDKDYSQNYVMFLARRDDRTIITCSIKCVNALELVHKNHIHRQSKLQDYEQLLDETIEKEKNPQPQRPTGGLVFDHEVNRFKLNSTQIQERIENLQEEIADATKAHRYKYYQVKARGRDAQLEDVVNKFKLYYIRDRMFSRCTSCNGVMYRIPLEEKESIKQDVDWNTYEENGKNNFFLLTFRLLCEMYWMQQNNLGNRKREYKTRTCVSKSSYFLREVFVQPK
jgi:uncharacterized protein with PIN domain